MRDYRPVESFRRGSAASTAFGRSRSSPSPRHSCVHDQANLEILVDFEARARVDYTAYFRLRQDLFKLAGRQVDLICKNTASLRGAGQDLARAQVLYAA